jgi:hypothetical protein
VPNLVHVYAHTGGGSIETLRRAANDANGLQTQYKFVLVPLIDGLTGKRGLIDVSNLERQLLETVPELRGLIVCEESFPDGEILVEILPTRAYLSTDVRLGQSPNDPSLRLFFLYQLIAAALTVGIGLSADANERMTHRPPIGCLWDWWVDANQRSAAMVAARICPACEASLIRHGDLSEALLMAARQMLDYVRRTLLTGSSEVPNKIFVAHGRGEDWVKLVDMLKGWGLSVDSFESQPTAGKLVTARWQEMLNSARLAFAVMTPDDPGATVDIKRARQNVIHEIGLCHARLGIFDTIVLIAEGAEEFSNIAGVIHIGFREGRLDEERDRIKACLVERGILEG